MITIVIPTRNRAYTLKKVLHTYYTQAHVSQIVFVNDDSNDRTIEVIQHFSNTYPHITTTLMNNDQQRGASYCRNLGVQAAVNPYILFGEDDAYLSKTYAETLLKKLQKNSPSVGIVSGRLIIMEPGESPEHAVTRFGNGNPKNKKLFSFAACSHIPDAYFEKDSFIPLTHALILTTKQLLLKYPYDPFYSLGNAFREESDFQMHAYTEGHNILVTNAAHCLHLHPKEVRQGGHRISHLKALYYKIFYTRYFFKKYYGKLKKRCHLRLPRFAALALYTFLQVKELGFAFFKYLRELQKKSFSRFLSQRL